MAKSAEARKTTSRRRVAKPKTTDVLVVAVLDRSGSMGSCRDATIEGWNTYLADLQADEEGETFLTILGFDHEREVWSDGEPVAGVLPLTHDIYVPRGSTALYDSIAHGLALADKKLSQLGREDMKVLVAIITDGFENASQEYAREAGGLARIKALIEDYEGRGNFTVTYLSSDLNVSAPVAAAYLGISSGNAATVGRSGATGPKGATGQAMSALSASTSSLRSSVGARTDSLYEDAGQAQDFQDEESRKRTAR